MHWIFEEPVYGSQVIVVQCPLIALEAIVRDLTKTPDLEIWEEGDDKEDFGAHALTFELEGPWAVVWFDITENPQHTAGHEFTHVAEHILRSVGVKPKGEALAYYIGWLTREFYILTKEAPGPLLEPLNDAPCIQSTSATTTSTPQTINTDLNSLMERRR